MPSLTRRQVMGQALSAAAAATAGCANPSARPQPRTQDAAADLPLVDSALALTAELLTVYARARRSNPGARADLDAAVAHHRTHHRDLLTVRGRLGAVVDIATPSASPSPSSAGVPTVDLSGLAARERAASGRNVRAAGQAERPEIARLLASIGGAQAQHAVVLSLLAARA